jgi:DNA-binding SARP family transcriptional activator
MNATADARSSEVENVRLDLLKTFELRFGDRPIPVAPSTQRLLALLALNERPLLRPFVAGTLWLELPDDRASANLRSALWRVNRSGRKVVEATNLQLRLAPDVRVDVHETAELARRLLANSATWGRREVAVAREQLTGELLPDWYDAWLMIERERLRQLSLHALEALGEQLLAARRLGEALETALAALEIEPLRESAHRLLIKIHIEEGNLNEAVRQFAFCSRLFRDHLGIVPSPQLSELVANVRIPQAAR